jgi:hypothetical protein
MQAAKVFRRHRAYIPNRPCLRKAKLGVPPFTGPLKKPFLAFSTDRLVKDDSLAKTPKTPRSATQNQQVTQ